MTTHNFGAPSFLFVESKYPFIWIDCLFVRLPLLGLCLIQVSAAAICLGGLGLSLSERNAPGLPNPNTIILSYKNRQA